MSFFACFINVFIIQIAKNLIKENFYSFISICWKKIPFGVGVDEVKFFEPKKALIFSKSIIRMNC